MVVVELSTYAQVIHMADNLYTGSGVFDSIFNEVQPEDAANPQGAEQADEEQEVIAEEVSQDETDEGESEGEEQAEEQGNEPAVYKIKAAGEEHELGIDQLIEYAQKGIGFNRNSEKQAREHKAEMALLAEERKAVAGEFERAAQYLEILGETQAGKEHLEYLMDYDLPEYKRIKAMQDEVKAQAEKARTDRQAEEIKIAISLIEEKFPSEWVKTDSRQKLLEDGAKFFESLGMTAQEIASVTSGPAYIAAIKAKRYDDLMKKVEQNKAAPPKKLTPKVTHKQPAKPQEYDAVTEFFPFLK